MMSSQVTSVPMLHFVLPASSPFHSSRAQGVTPALGQGCVGTYNNAFLVFHLLFLDLSFHPFNRLSKRCLTYFVKFAVPNERVFWPILTSDCRIRPLGFVNALGRRTLLKLLYDGCRNSEHWPPSTARPNKPPRRKFREKALLHWEMSSWVEGCQSRCEPTAYAVYFASSSRSRTDTVHQSPGFVEVSYGVLSLGFHYLFEEVQVLHTAGRDIYDAQ
ncbi:hypothetical protein BJX76DRAFT_2256 [Aspergillus varians]